jgi:hypothetical protein
MRFLEVKSLCPVLSTVHFLSHCCPGSGLISSQRGVGPTGSQEPVAPACVLTALALCAWRAG